jgi:hypothetical protein
MMPIKIGNGKEHPDIDHHVRSEDEQWLPEDLPDILGEGFTMSRSRPTDHDREMLEAILRMNGGMERMIAGQERIEKGLSSGQKTQLPNWLIVLLAGIFVTLIGFVYTTIDRRLNDLKQDQSTITAWMQNTREQLIRNGWKPDINGNLMPPDPLKGK